MSRKNILPLIAIAILGIIAITRKQAPIYQQQQEISYINKTGTITLTDNIYTYSSNTILINEQIRLIGTHEIKQPQGTIQITENITLIGQHTILQTSIHKTGSIILTDIIQTQGVGEVVLNEQLFLVGTHTIQAQQASISKAGSITLTDAIQILGDVVLNEQVSLSGSHTIA